MKTETDKINLWAYHHCERENAKWTDAPDICPLKGQCPHCQNQAIEAIRGNDRRAPSDIQEPSSTVVVPETPVIELTFREKVIEWFKQLWCLTTHGSWHQTWPVHHSWHIRCLKCYREYDIDD